MYIHLKKTTSRETVSLKVHTDLPDILLHISSMTLNRKFLLFDCLWILNVLLRGS
jgi:hypothetical protein